VAYVERKMYISTIRSVRQGAVTEMVVRNETKSAVESEIARRRISDSEMREGCLCPLCEADVTALALTNLPPGYRTTYAGRQSQGEGYVDDIRDAVDTAWGKVSSRPKHRSWARESLPSNLRLVDLSFREAEAMVHSTLAEMGGACSCERCRADTVAHALNRHSPKYGVEREGQTRMPSHEQERLRASLRPRLIVSAATVAARPRHPVGIGSRALAACRIAARRLKAKPPPPAS
jgi:hypothetical protein